ncbi:MAG: polysaccharide biosynthesis C-terminal domain-containing protein, partial [Candidatus Falkowbacteria bacterium]
VILNLILIPRLEAAGASLTVLLTNLFMFILGMRVVPQIIKYDYKKIIVIFIKSLLAVAAMGLVCYYLKNRVNLILTIMSAGASYFIALYIFKGFSKEDVNSILKSFSRSKKDNLVN